MLELELHTAKEAAITAGKHLNHFFGNVRQITKKGDIDLVTEADLLAEKTIMDILGRSFPDDNILAEESGNHSKASGRTWIIDPLDGTTNFVHGFPFFAVSIGLEVDGDIEVGVVYNPFMDELFEAGRGQGAFLNQKPISVSPVERLDEALLATGFPYLMHKTADRVLDLFSRMVFSAQGVRRPGSAAIDMCYVASGRFDGFWEQDLKPWDTAAGIVIVEEAGGALSTYQGNPYTPYSKTVVAANPLIHREMISLLNG